MRTRTLLAALTVLAFGSLAGLASAQNPPAPTYTENGFSPVLLDTSASREARTQAFTHIIDLANQGQVRAQDLAGTLYWQGANIEGSPVPVNLKLARRLLANAAVHGDVLAMAKMAELELSAGHAGQAMVWAQLYVRYLAPLVPVRQGRGQYSAYGATLIQRIEKAGGKIDQATRINVATMIKRFNSTIRDGMVAYNKERQNGKTILTQPPEGNDSIKVSNINGVAEYMVGFDTHGNATRVWPLDGFPDPKLDTVLRYYMQHVHANSVGSDAGMRYLRVAITHNAAKWIELRPRN